MSFLSNEIQRVRKSVLARNAGWMLVGQGLNVALQAGYFVLLARLLGVREYGVFAGAFAFAAIAMPYSALGSGLLFVRYVSTEHSKFAAYWGNILIATLSIGALLTLVLYLLAPHLLNPASASVVLLVALGNCVFGQLVACMGQMFQAFEQLHMTAMLNVLTNFLRLLAVVALAIFVHHAGAWQWALASLLVSVLAAVAGSAILALRFGPPRFVASLFRSTAAEGLGFSFAGSTQAVYNDIDKSMLSHYGMNVENGIYTMAYRLADIASIPITALDAASLPRYFRQSKEGFGSVRALSSRLAKRAALVGLVMAGWLFLAAPLIPRVLGSGFGASVLALRWLCLLPALRGIHQLTGSAITGLGFQRYRTAAQFATATLNFGLNLWLIPLHGWLGAAWASLAADGTLGLMNLLILRGLRGRSPELGECDELSQIVTSHA